jgi:serine kinase of HPr protein (carbohydrate metabolism regulator)
VNNPFAGYLSISFRGVIRITKMDEVPYCEGAQEAPQTEELEKILKIQM